MTTESETRIVDALDRVLARLDALERRIDGLGALTPEAAAALNQVAGRIPTVVEAAGSVAAFAWREAEKRDIDPVQTALRATDALPHLVKLLDRVDLLEKAVARTDLADALLDASATIDPATLSDVLKRSAPLLARFSRLLARPELPALLDAVDGATLGIAAQATSALVEGRSTPATPVGPIKALFSLNEPDVQRALGFALAVARKFGQRLN